jgi:lipopolysaccharide exporter
MAAAVSTGSANLAARSLSAVFWGAGGTLLRLLLQVSAQVVLARLLGPEQFGIFAIGATVISFSAFLSDIGLAYGLIQKAEVTARDVRFVFTWQVIMGALVTGMVWWGAGPIAAFFGEPRALPIIEVLSALCMLNALAAPSLNLLKRQLDFKQIQIAQLISYAAGYILVGIPLAVAGQQVWALVAAWLVQAGLNLVLLYRATGHALAPLIWYEQARAQSGYGGAVLATNLVNWVINNIDRVVVGRTFGSRDIGLYATSYNLFYNPTASALGVVQPVFFSASSRVADDEQRIQRGYRALLGFVTTLVLPVFVVVALVTQPFIVLLYGPQWQAAAALCQPVALAMPLFMLWGLTTPLLWVAGKASREFMIQLPLALLWIVVCAAASRVSVLAVAWSVLALSFVRCTVVVVTAMRLRHMPWASLWAGMRGGLVLTALVAAAVALLGSSLHAAAAGLQVAAAAALALLVGLLAVRSLPGLVSPELAQLFGKVHGRLPARWRALVARLGFGGDKQHGQ